MLDRVVRMDEEIKPVAPPSVARRRRVQRRLVVGAVDDRLEVEADEAAHDVLRRLRTSNGRAGSMFGSEPGRIARRTTEDLPSGPQLGRDSGAIDVDASSRIRPAVGGQSRSARSSGAADAHGPSGSVNGEASRIRRSQVSTLGDDRTVIRRMKGADSVEADDQETGFGIPSLSPLAALNAAWTFAGWAYSTTFGTDPERNTPKVNTTKNNTIKDDTTERTTSKDDTSKADTTKADTTKSNTTEGKTTKGKQSQQDPRGIARSAAVATKKRAAAAIGLADDIGEQHATLDGELSQLGGLKLGGANASNPKTINSRVAKVAEQLDELDARVGPIWSQRQAELAATELAARKSAGVLEGRAQAAGVDVSALTLAIGELDHLGNAVSLTVRRPFVAAIDQACQALTPTVVIAEGYRVARAAAVTALERADTLLPQPAPLPNQQPQELLHKLRSHRSMLDWKTQSCNSIADSATPDWSALSKQVADMTKITKWVDEQCDLAPHRNLGLVSQGDTVIPAGSPSEATKTGGYQELQRLNQTLQCLGNSLEKSSKWPGFPADGEWGSTHLNLGHGLPEGCTYREYYVKPWVHDAKGSDGLCRVVVGSDHRVWYSRSHYGKQPAEGPAYVLLSGVTR